MRQILAVTGLLAVVTGLTLELTELTVLTAVLLLEVSLLPLGVLLGVERVGGSALKVTGSGGRVERGGDWGGGG